MNVKKENKKWWLEAWKYKSPRQLAEDYIQSMTTEELHNEMALHEKYNFECDPTRYQEEVERCIWQTDNVYPILEKLESRELGFYEKWENRYTLIIDFVKHEKTIEETNTMGTTTSGEQHLTQMHTKDLEQMDLPELIKLAGMIEEAKQAKEAKMQWLSSVDIFKEVFHITHEEYKVTWNEIYDEDYENIETLYINIKEALSNAPFDIAHLEDKEWKWKNKAAALVEVQKTSSLHMYIANLYKARFFEKHARFFFPAVNGFAEYYQKSRVIEHEMKYGTPLPPKEF